MYSDYVFLQNDSIVSYEPCILFGLLITPEAGFAARVLVYDGQNIRARQIADLKTDTGITTMVNFMPGITLGHGLYIKLYSHVETVTGLFGWDVRAKPGEVVGG